MDSITGFSALEASDLMTACNSFVYDFGFVPRFKRQILTIEPVVNL
jgi:hypothetical protein